MFFEEYKNEKRRIEEDTYFLDFKKSVTSNEEFLVNLTDQIFDKPIFCQTHDETYILNNIFWLFATNSDLV